MKDIKECDRHLPSTRRSRSHTHTRCPVEKIEAGWTGAMATVAKNHKGLSSCFVLAGGTTIEQKMKGKP